MRVCKFGLYAIDISNYTSHWAQHMRATRLRCVDRACAIVARVWVVGAGRVCSLARWHGLGGGVLAGDMCVGVVCMMGGHVDCARLRTYAIVYDCTGASWWRPRCPRMEFARCMVDAASVSCAQAWHCDMGVLADCIVVSHVRREVR